MSNPFLLTEPTSISFSGGRTSALMLRRILDAHGGRLRDDTFVLFANTGRERPETLDFVHEVAARWEVDVVWLERVGIVEGLGEPGVREVDYATASRNAEPFDTLLSERDMLPNVRARFCTTELKVRTMHRWLKKIGGFDSINTVIGFRADEPSRVAKRCKRRPRSEGILAEYPLFPLTEAGVSVADVAAFWAAQDFDLKLRPHEGNCDLCFLKSQRKRVRIMRDRPDLAAWWIAHEERAKATAKTPQGARFRDDGYPYKRLLSWTQEPTLPGTLRILADDADELLDDDCACTD